MIRRAEMKDIDQIEAIYDRILEAEEQGRMTIGWIRGVYPVRQTAAAAVERGDMFVEEIDGEIVSSGIINQQQVPEYADCSWQYEVPDEKVMVLHTLVVDPRVGGRGYGKAFVKFYEQYAWEMGCPYLRLDTQIVNENARKMYRDCGYTEPGIVGCTFNGIPNVRLICLEKKIGKERAEMSEELL